MDVEHVEIALPPAIVEIKAPRGFPGTGPLSEQLGMLGGHLPLNNPEIRADAPADPEGGIKCPEG